MAKINKIIDIIYKRKGKRALVLCTKHNMVWKEGARFVEASGSACKECVELCIAGKMKRMEFHEN